MGKRASNVVDVCVTHMWLYVGDMSANYVMCGCHVNDVMCHVIINDTIMKYENKQKHQIYMETLAGKKPWVEKKVSL